MKNIYKHIFLCLLLSGGSIPALAEEIFAIKADRIETVTSGLIENGIIIIRDGKISTIGADVEIPDTANIIDAHDKTVFPGLVNPMSRIGLSAPQGGGPASHPNYRIADELYPFQDAYKRILQAGFTTLGFVPWGNGITGQGAIARSFGKTAEEMLIVKSGLLMINYQANQKANKVIKDAFESAKKQMKSNDPKIKPLVRALQGEIPTFVQCQRPAETLHLLKVLKHYNKLKLVLIAGAENYLIANKLAENKIPVVFPAQIDFERFTRNRINVPKILDNAGVKIACRPKTDDVRGCEDFLREMAELVKSGLDKEVAKKSVTIYPAEMLGINYRVGSLEVGKDANLLILSGDPLDIGTRIHLIMLEGKIVYQTP